MHPFTTLLLAVALFEGQAGRVAFVGDDNERVDFWTKELRENWNLGQIPELEVLEMALKALNSERLMLKRVVNGRYGRAGDFQPLLEKVEARMAETRRLIDLQNCWILSRKMEARQQQQTITTESEALTAHQISVSRTIFEYAFVVALRNRN